MTSQARKFESVGLGSNLGICFFFLFTGVFVNSKTGCLRTLGETKAQVENSVFESRDCDIPTFVLSGSVM